MWKEIKLRKEPKMLKPFSVQLEEQLFNFIETGAKKIGIQKTDYVRNILNQEKKDKTVLNRLTGK